MLCAQVIRELREEVEKLRLMLVEGGGSPGTVSQGQKGKEFDELRERLLISQNLMDDMSKTWEEKLKETERVHQVSMCTSYAE